MRRAFVVGLLALVAGAWALVAGARPSLTRTWSAAAPHYDYLEAITFGRDGAGSMVWGYGQAVRCDVDFRWRRVARDVVELRYLREAEPPRRLRYATERDRFDVRDPGPGGDRTIHYGCRLTFDATPFPAGCDTQRIYYGCVDER